MCIADEVQTGLGRLGGFYCGFAQQAARPDMVVLGKPLGSGHPPGAVATIAEIARSFDNGIEFFSKFGGSTLSCRIGTEVLRIAADRATRVPATRLAGYVKNRLRAGRILIGTEGPADNVLKIRLPLTIEPDDVDQLLETLDRVLGETP